MDIKEIVTGYLKVLDCNHDIKTLDDIKILMQKHLSTFPFSNVSVLLNDEISLDLDAIYRKLIVNKRGGYCFEHNKLFYEVLKYLGFEVQYFLARVVNNQDIEVAQTHRFTLLTYNNEDYLVDVGFGSNCASTPVKFEDEYTSSHLNRSYRIEKGNDGTYKFQILKEDGFFTLYTFDLNKCYEIDFELGHFYSHKHPNASFIKDLMLCRITQSSINSLRNKDCYKTSMKGKKEVNINSLKKFQTILKDDFNCFFNEDETTYIYENYVK